MIEANSSVHAQDVGLHYDELSRYYKLIWGEHVHHGYWETGRERVAEAVFKLSQKVAEAAGAANDARICDVGCGYGGTSQLLADDYGADVTGLTVSRAQYEEALRRPARRGKLRFLLRDWLKSGLKAESFDAVIAIESSEHMVDKAAFFAEAARVLKPGGRLVVCAWCAAESPSEWEKRHLLVPICTEGRMPSLLSPSEYEAAAKAAGLRPVRAQDITKHVRRTWSRTILNAVSHFATHPQDWKDLSPRHLASSDFVPSLFRIALAYRTGAMSYHFLSFEKGAASRVGLD